MPVAETTTPRIHPEMAEKRQSVFARLWDSLVHPVVRLPVEIPWNLKQFSRMYVVAAVYYAVGSIVPLMLIFGCAMVALKLWPETMVELLLVKDGSPNAKFLLITTIISFVSGFGAELLYFNNQLRKAGLSLFSILHLNLRSLDGKWGEAFKRATYALVLGLIGQDLIERIPHLPRPHQATAEMASGLDGSGLIVFAALAAIMAPFFEEVIFRGFLFNSLRKIFREGRLFKLLHNSPRVADYFAVGLSAFMFAAAHMDASAFLQLFLLGIILAELYRRSGTLVCPILLHAMNNLVATLLIAFKS